MESVKKDSTKHILAIEGLTDLLLKYSGRSILIWDEGCVDEGLACHELDFEGHEFEEHSDEIFNLINKALVENEELTLSLEESDVKAIKKRDWEDYLKFLLQKFVYHKVEKFLQEHPEENLRYKLNSFCSIGFEFEAYAKFGGELLSQAEDGTQWTGLEATEEFLEDFRNLINKAVGQPFLNLVYCES